jgi:hypothetical protein
VSRVQISVLLPVTEPFPHLAPRHRKHRESSNGLSKGFIDDIARLKQIHGYHSSHDESKLVERKENNGTAKEKVVKFKHENLLRNGLASESNSHGAHEQGSTRSVPTQDVTKIFEKDHSPKPKPKKYVFQAVVVDSEPPYRTGLVSPNRKTPSSQQGDIYLFRTGSCAQYSSYHKRVSDCQDRASEAPGSRQDTTSESARG